MPTTSGHTKAILASKVTSTDVYGQGNEKIGHVEDVVLDKTSDRILFAVVGFGGFLGIGEKFHALPWAALDYAPEIEGYRTNLTRQQLEGAPTYNLDEMTKNDGIGKASADYYSKYL